MRSRSSLLIVVFAAVLWSCSERQRLNPLDPSNPHTQGRPSPVRLSSNRKIVSISWDLIDNRSVTGYTVRRFNGDGMDSSIIATVSFEDTLVNDTISHYDSTYSYTVTAVTETWESDPSEPSTIVPGPFNYWIADFYGGTISQVSYDGAHILLTDFHYSPVSIDFDPERKSLWIASLYPSRVIRMSLDGEVQFVEELSSTPADLAVETESGDVFIATVGTSELVRMRSDGSVLEKVPCEITVSRDSHLALDSEYRRAWLSVADSQTVIRLDLEAPGQVERFPVSPLPRALSALPSLGIVWVATDSGVVAIHDDGSMDTYLPNHIMYDLSVNRETENIWLATSDRLGRQWSIQLLEQTDGRWKIGEFDPKITGMFSRIAANPGSENPGILLYDASAHQIVRLNPQGIVVGSLPGFSPYIDVDIEHD